VLVPPADRVCYKLPVDTQIADTQSEARVFRALTVVFDVSVTLFLHCSFRVLSLDAAFKYTGRKDLNYIILEGITAGNVIFPLGFGLCFGETEPNYAVFLNDVLSYSDTLRASIDNVDSRINGDRHGGLRNAVERTLQHGAEILHNDLVHLQRNVHRNCHFPDRKTQVNANQLLSELLHCNDMADLDTLWQAIRVFSPAMCTYLGRCSRAPFAPHWQQSSVYRSIQLYLRYS
jgi:hypothetical protein